MKKLHFQQEEFAARQGRALKSMAQEKLDGLLMFKGESHYYLSGFDSYQYVFYTCLYLGIDGRMGMVTRASNLNSVERTSIVDNVRYWKNQEGVNPALELSGLLEDMGCQGKRLGVELESHGLTGRSWDRTRAALDGFCTLVDASELVSRLRLVKSPAELAYVRRAAEIADDVLREFHRMAVPGVFEGDIYGMAMNKVFQSDGDMASHDYIIDSGPEGRLFPYHTGRRHVEKGDTVVFEYGVPFRHYHANIMSVVLTRQPTQGEIAQHKASVDALAAIKDALRPGRRLGQALEAMDRAMDEAGFGDQKHEACGYALGATFIPNWIDWPMIIRNNPLIVEPNMVFFPIAVMAGSPMGVANTVVVTENGCEDLSKVPLELVVNA